MQWAPLSMRKEENSSVCMSGVSSRYSAKSTLNALSTFSMREYCISTDSGANISRYSAKPTLEGNEQVISTVQKYLHGPQQDQVCWVGMFSQKTETTAFP